MITMVVGLDSDYNCTGVYITKHSETSGLGAKAADTTDGAWRDNLVGQGDGLALTKEIVHEGQGHGRGHLRRDDHVPRRRHRSADRHQRGQVAGLRRAEA